MTASPACARRLLPVVVIAMFAAASAGCATTGDAAKPAGQPMYSSNPAVEQAIKDVTNLGDALAGARVDEALTRAARVAPAIEPQDQSPKFLRELNVSLSESVDGAPLSEIMRALSRQGMNLVTMMPIDSFYYTGFGFAKTDGESALRMILGPMGLDYRADPETKSVEIVPMEPKTWRLNIGPRIAKFSQEGETNGSSGGQAYSGGGGSSGAGSGGGSSGGRGGVDIGEESATSSVAVDDDFWKSLQVELENRMKILVPSRVRRGGSDLAAPMGVLSVPPVPAVPNGAFQMPTPPSAAMVGAASGAAEMFDEVMVGRVMINASTGAVTVQAPSFLMRGVSKYLDALQEELYTTIVVDGHVVQITSDEDEQQGIDFNGFRKFAEDRYGIVLNNQVFNQGFSFTPASPTAPASVSLPGAAANTALGIVRTDNLLRVFLAFLESTTNVRSVSQPHIATSSGVPAVVTDFTPQYYVQVSQQAASGENNAAVASRNELIPFQFGSALRINPRFDSGSQSIRIQIALTQVVQAGLQSVDQAVSDTDGGTTTLRSQIPLSRRINLHSETNLLSGSLIVLGGQRQTVETVTESGITGLRKIVPFLFGSKRETRKTGTYYVALTVRAIDTRTGRERLPSGGDA